MEELFSRYRDKGILLDTNLMLLLVIGTYRPTRIQTFKRTEKYLPEDQALLLRILAYFERRVTTPNILTEVDNLARQLPENEHASIANVVAQLTRTLFEVYRPSLDVTQVTVFPAIGLTDSLTLVLSEELLVITDDFGLSNRITSLGRDALNINHIRSIV